MNHIFPLLSRLLLAPLFINAAIHKIKDPEGTAEAMRSGGINFATEVFLYGAIAFLLLGSVSVLLGYKTRLGAFLLLLFIVPTTLLYHWNFTDEMQFGFLLANAGIASSLLMLMAYGPGRVSLDAKLGK